MVDRQMVGRNAAEFGAAGRTEKVTRVPMFGEAGEAEGVAAVGQDARLVYSSVVGAAARATLHLFKSLNLKIDNY